MPSLRELHKAGSQVLITHLPGPCVSTFWSGFGHRRGDFLTHGSLLRCDRSHKNFDFAWVMFKPRQ